MDKETLMNSSFSASQAAPEARSITSRRWTVTRLLLAIGGAGPILFLALATLAGFLTPSYDMASQAVSELALGAVGWLQTANFFLFGCAIIAFAIGLFRSLPRGSWVGTALLIICGTALFASGIFPTDPKGAPETDTGGLHNLLFLVVMLTLSISYIFSALSFRKLAGWRGFTWLTACMPIIVFSLLFVLIGFSSDPGDPLYSIGGLVQRLLLASAFGWMTATAWRLQV